MRRHRTSASLPAKVGFISVEIGLEGSVYILHWLDAVDRWPLLEGLVRHAADASDHNLPKMIWFGMEPVVADAPADSLRLARESEIPMLTRHIARRLSNAGKLREVTESVLASIEGSPAKTLQLLLGVRDSLEGRFDVQPPDVWPTMMAAADLNHGKELFRKTCHQLHGEGGQVGPDMTGANRGNLEYLLSNILTPSAEIQVAYRMQIVLTDDGRVYSGIPSEVLADHVETGDGFSGTAWA